jgi:superfamily I DNA/RNA helicase
MKGLVAIDEATDFTPAQIGCMFLLSRPRLNSLTLSGDLMQQMNGNGIDSWEDLKELLPGLEIKSLAKSYRQTPKLLNLATALYKNRFNNEPGFYAAQKDDKDDPEALVFISPDFDAKVNWVAQRIAELYHIYEKIIPNIAIFVRNNDQIEKLTKALNDNEILIRNMIHVKGCVGEGEIGSAEFIRIFNINLIKGMEFETVFFMDVDEYGRDEMEMLDKLIYVGVSRATYYLAITLNDSFPERLAPVKHLLVENGTWSTELESDY